jgi:Ca-activated chloride channel family protein
MNDDPMKKSAAMFNLGNSLLKSDKLEESIEAYKGSLKLKPESPEAKYNLAYAQDMLKKKKEQQQQQQQNKDKQDQKKDQDKKDKNDKKDENKDEQKNQDQKQQQEQQGVSKDDAERLLNALANEEKNVQEKVKLAKASKERVRTVKNW